MFERFTERARQVVIMAQDEARRHNHSSIQTMHVLVGLVREEHGLAARVLASFDFTEDFSRGRLLDVIPPSEDELDKTRQVPFTPRVKKMLEDALREALSLGHNYIGTEHILLAALRADAPHVDEFLGGIPRTRVREEVIRMLSGSGKRRETTPKKREPDKAPEAAEISLLIQSMTKVAENLQPAIQLNRIETKLDFIITALAEIRREKDDTPMPITHHPV